MSWDCTTAFHLVLKSDTLRGVGLSVVLSGLVLLLHMAQQTGVLIFWQKCLEKLNPA